MDTFHYFIDTSKSKWLAAVCGVVIEVCAVGLVTCHFLGN
jgi:hypothetical protein